MEKIIAGEDLLKGIENLLKEYEVIGPRDLPHKGMVYRPIEHSADIDLGERFTIEPIKKFFLSPSEYIFKETALQDKEIPEEPPCAEKKRIIFGVRPCEARGIELLDKVFDPSTHAPSLAGGMCGSTGSPSLEPSRAQSRDSGCRPEGAKESGAPDLPGGLHAEYKDIFYINRRRNTVIAGLSCSGPDGNCFCASMGGSPADSRGMDALIFATEGSPDRSPELAEGRSRGASGGEFIIEIITDKGKDIFSSWGRDLSAAEKKAWQTDKEKRKDRLTKRIKVPETLDGIFESEYWRQVSFPCVSCGICTFLCPTCHCFDLVDEERKRLRCYDGCAFGDFTLEASGVNPRPTKKERYRQRVFHKFDYFKKNFGENLCVGCGRCIRHCPVKIDIAEIVNNAPASARHCEESEG